MPLPYAFQLQPPGAQPIQNPVQNPMAGPQQMPQDWQSAIQATAALYPAMGKAQRAALMAEAIRAMQDKAQAAGQAAGNFGPAGVRTGVGPSGFMTSFGDAIGQLFAKGQRGELEQGAALTDDQLNALLAEAYKRNAAATASSRGYESVPQGSPLTVSGQ